MNAASNSAASNSERPEGQPVSLWVATAGTTDYPVLSGDVETDVAVIGAGIAGLTAALALKRAGHTVAVIEAARVGTGVTGHTTGKVTSLHRLAYKEIVRGHGADTARIYGQANEAAIEHVARVVGEEGIDCDFRRVANYTYAASAEALELVRAEAALAERLGLPGTFTSDVPLPFPVKGAVRFDGQAQIHSMKYLQGLARAVDGGAASCSRGRVRCRSAMVPRAWSRPSRGPSAPVTLSSPRTCRSAARACSTCGVIRTVHTSSPDAWTRRRWTPRSSAPTTRCAPSSASAPAARVMS